MAPDFILFGVKKGVRNPSRKGLIKMSKRGENIRKRKDGRWEARIKQIDGTLHSTYARSYNELKEKIRGMATPPKRTEDETQEHKNS